MGQDPLQGLEDLGPHQRIGLGGPVTFEIVARREETEPGVHTEVLVDPAQRTQLVAIEQRLRCESDLAEFGGINHSTGRRRGPGWRHGPPRPRGSHRTTE